MFAKSCVARALCWWSQRSNIYCRWCGGIKFCILAKIMSGRGSLFEVKASLSHYDKCNCFSVHCLQLSQTWKKESVIRLIHCKQEGASWLMVHFALYRNLSSRFLSFPPALPLISPPSLGLKTGGVFPFCQSQLCLIGLSLYQCKQKRGNSVGCFLLSKKPPFGVSLIPGAGIVIAITYETKWQAVSTA